MPKPTEEGSTFKKLTSKSASGTGVRKLTEPSILMPSPTAVPLKGPEEKLTVKNSLDFKCSAASTEVMTYCLSSL